MTNGGDMCSKLSRAMGGCRCCKLPRAVGEDRLSKLPDSLLCCEILSKLSIREAICCSILSRRWQCLWRGMPHLKFSSKDFVSSLQIERLLDCSTEDEDAEDFNIEEIIDNVLVLHSADPLESFRFEAIFNEHRTDKICGWIDSVSLKGVKHITLRNLRTGTNGVICRRVRFRDLSVTEVPNSLFKCKSLTSLELESFTFVHIPTNFDGLPFLETCSFKRVRNLNGHALQQLIELCPVLQNLVLRSCDGLKILKIHAPNLSYLNIEDCSIKSLEVVCPRLINIKILQRYCLMDSQAKLLEGLSVAQSVKKITLLNFPVLSWVTTLGSFPQLEELTIHCERYKEMEALREVLVDTTFPNLKKVTVHLGFEMGKMQITLLGFLLRNSPLLNIMKLSLPFCAKNTHDKKFIDQVLNLEMASRKASLSTTTDRRLMDRICGRLLDFGRLHKCP